MRIPRRHSRSLERDLARLADGTIEPRRREDVERTVAESGELQSRLGEQRRAVAAVRGTASERAPLVLRLRRRLPREAVARRRPRGFSLGLAGVVGALAWTLATLGSGQSVLTVASAATIAVRPAVATVAAPSDDAAELPGVRAAGLPFPYWEDAFGWRATGVRRDVVDGRLLTTVFYRSEGRRIAYTIIPGTSLPAGHDVETIRRGRLEIGTFMTGQQRVVTWLRRGHTCVLSGAGVPLDALLKLAAWRGHGTLPY